MKNNNVRIIAIVCCAILAVWDIVDLFGYFEFLWLIATIGSVLVVVALLAKTPALSAVGFGLMTLPVIINILRHIGDIFEGWLPISFLLLWILNIAAYILLMLVSIKPKSAKSLGTVAAIVSMIRLAVSVIADIIEGYSFSATGFIWGLLFAASAMLLGLTYDCLGNNAPAVGNSVLVSETPIAQKILQTGNVDKILRLKEFLDKGIITQEEFDQKKKELLNL